MSSQDELIGSVVAGRYRVVERLGQGGMGNVYLAVHEAIERRIALKVLRLEFSMKPDLVSRFQQEAISASRIEHPGVLDVFDFGRLDNGCFFIAMELLEGGDLADELERRRVVEPVRAVGIALQICRALAAAHARGVVHRDLKPENVYLHVTSEGDEQVKVVDFGIAQLRTTEQLAEQQTQRRRLTRTGMIFGTPEYMSPEQAVGKNVDRRADVYAAGIIVYEMLTGAVPFTGDSFFGVLNAHLNQPLPPMRAFYPELAVSAELEAVVARALAKSPDERWPSMRELADALAQTPEGRGAERSEPRGQVTSVQFADTQPQREPPPALAVPEAPRRSRRSAAGLAVLVLALLSSAVLAVVLVGNRLKAAAETPAAASSAPTQPEPPATPEAPTQASAPVSASAPPAAEPPQVELSITTKPPGAVVLKSGFQICDRSPCTIRVPRDAQVELEARKGTLRGSSKVLAVRDQNVSITLTAPAAGAPPPARHDCWTTVETPDGLKVPKRIPCR